MVATKDKQYETICSCITFPIPTEAHMAYSVYWLRYGLDDPGFDLWEGQVDFLLYKSHGRHTQPPWENGGGAKLTTNTQRHC
jgi:hypothetical protein